jgi:hypothetical protein
MACTRCEQSRCRVAWTRASSAAAITDNPSSGLKVTGAGRGLALSRWIGATASELWAFWICGSTEDALSASPHRVSAPTVFARNRMAYIVMQPRQTEQVTQVLGHPPGAVEQTSSWTSETPVAEATSLGDRVGTTEVVPFPTDVVPFPKGAVLPKPIHGFLSRMVRARVYSCR